MFDDLPGWLSFLPRDSLLSLLLLVLIASIFFNLYFVSNRVGKLRKEPRGLHLRALVKSYLLDQKNKTRHEIQYGLHRLNKPAMRFREAYLAIESKCLDREEDSNEFWNLLNARLVKLLEIFDSKQGASFLKFVEEKIALIHRELELAPSSVNKEGVVKSLEKLHKICVDHEGDAKKIQHVSDKLSAIFFKLRSANYRIAASKVITNDAHLKKGQSLLERIDDSASSMMAHAAYLKERAAAGHEPLSKVEACSSNMAEYANNLGGEYHGFKRGMDLLSSELHSSSSDDEIRKVDQKIVDLSEQMVAASEKEIERLKALLNEKKEIILALEEQLSVEATLPKKNVEDASHLKTLQSEDIDLLRKNLRESEQCIRMLEDELELLKAQTHETGLDHSKQQEHALALLQNNIEQANRELQGQREELGRKAMIFEFLRECIDSSSLADVALFLYQCVQDLGYDCELLVSTGGKKLELNRLGKLSVSQKMLIDSVRTGEFNGSDRGRKMVFRYHHVGGVLRKDNGEVINESEKKSLVDLLVIADKVISRVHMVNTQTNSKREIAKLVNSYKYLVKEVDEAIDNLLRNAQKSAESSFTEVANIAKRGGLTAQLIAHLKAVQKEYVSELGAEERTKIKLRKSQLEILKKLEELET